MFEKTILITGGAGFIGSNFTAFFSEKYPRYRIINLDKLTYAGSLANLTECEGLANYLFVQGDIADRPLLAELFRRYQIGAVIHFAAESHVDNSITHPADFIETNIVGTGTLLEVARQFWMNGPNAEKPEFTGSRFHHISTDEVYGSLGETGFFKETTPYAPNSPYAASKASSDLLVRAWFQTYGLNVTISHSSNNYGPRQHREKLIPKTIDCCFHNVPIPVYGNGGNVRDWLYVQDHCLAIDRIFHLGRRGEVYNIGGGNEQTNLEVVRTVCRLMDRLKPRSSGSYTDLITFVEDRPGHDWRYALDGQKMETELSWRPEEKFESGLTKTITVHTIEKTPN